MTDYSKEILSKLARLSRIETIKDVPQLTHALFPGTHCPLMGAAMAAGGIKDCLLVIAGTDECSFYTKSMTVNKTFGGIGGRCVSIVLNSHDVTFGSAPAVHKAFKEIMQEYRPQCVLLVTTCVIEVIGDDYDAIGNELSREYNVPVLTIHTEHFKCEDHFPGLERTLTACLRLMEERPCNNSINLLGQRMGDFSETELYRILQQAGVKIGMQLPCGCTVDEIRNAAAAKVNIVVHDLALPLAQKMKEKFNIPYVYFDKFTKPERIMAAYKALFDCLELKLPQELERKFQECRELEVQAKNTLQGISYIYGNTPCECFECNAYLCEIGMVPQVIQSNRFKKENAEDIALILQHADPYICKAANITPLQKVYDELHPWIYMGHEFADRLQKKGIAVFHADRAGCLLGFEVNQFILQTMQRTIAEAKEYRKAAGL